MLYIKIESSTVKEDPLLFIDSQSLFLTTSSKFPVQDLLTPMNSISSSLSEAADLLL